MVSFPPLSIGLRDPFQMAELHGLLMRVILTIEPSRGMILQVHGCSRCAIPANHPEPLCLKDSRHTARAAASSTLPAVAGSIVTQVYCNSHIWEEILEL